MTKPPKKPLSLYNHFLKLERAAIAVTMPESATTCEVRSRRLRLHRSPLADLLPITGQQTGRRLMEFGCALTRPSIRLAMTEPVGHTLCLSVHRTRFSLRRSPL